MSVKHFFFRRKYVRLSSDIIKHATERYFSIIFLSNNYFFYHDKIVLWPITFIFNYIRLNYMQISSFCRVDDKHSYTIHFDVNAAYLTRYASNSSSYNYRYINYVLNTCVWLLCLCTILKSYMIIRCDTIIFNGGCASLHAKINSLPTNIISDIIDS